MDTFNIFILFPKDVSSVAITDENSYVFYLNQIKDIINRADCEKGSILHYDDSECQGFINALDELAYAGEFYLIKPRRIVSALLKNAIDWTDNNPKYEKTHLYLLWDFDSRSVNQEIPPSVKAAFEHQIIAQTDNRNLLLNLESRFYPHKKALFVFKDASTFEIQQKPVFAKIEKVNTFSDLEQLEQWFQENRTPRQFNRTDQRHNEKSKAYIKGKSPLLYDLSQAGVLGVVQKLLDGAVTDQHESKDLMNYDPTKARYIWFEYENDNPQNQYHGYHLAKPKSHEEDTVAVSKIPKRAKGFIDKKPKIM